jgi:hypothetical protein
MYKTILLIAGIIIILLSLLADVINIGREPGFGLLQIAGTIIGLVMIIFAIRKFRKKD